MKKDFNKVMAALKGIESNLLQVAIYNSFSPRCVIILESDSDNVLDQLEELRDFCRKTRLPFPLVVDRQFVLSSLDSYPLEFLDIISSRYQNLFAKEDVLATLTFTTANLRLQMEREVKSKWLLTRLTVLEQNPKPKVLAETLALSIRAIMPVLKGLCHLSGRPIPNDPLDLIAQASDVSNLNFGPLGNWLNLEKAELGTIKSYLGILANLMQYLDSLAND